MDTPRGKDLSVRVAYQFQFRLGVCIITCTLSTLWQEGVDGAQGAWCGGSPEQKMQL
jgi:hypothetical protein